MRLAARRMGIGAALLGAALVLLAALPADLGPGRAEAASGVRLVMVDDPACWFCRQWNTNVGRGYARSAEGRVAPLKRVRRGAPELRGLSPVIFTPTFIVMRGRTEVGRISGYSGPSHFYADLRGILTRAGHLRGS